MPAKRISKSENSEVYFLTFTVLRWYHLFNRYERWEILKDSLNYCTKNKNLEVIAYVFMINHIHLIVESPDVAGFIRDFKKHTARELMKNIQKTEPHVAKLFYDKNDTFSIWQETNMPILVQTEAVLEQKVNYTEFNPVTKRYVMYPEYWYYSSANPQSPVKIVSRVL